MTATTRIRDLAEELLRRIRWQEIITEYDEDDLDTEIIEAIKKLYIMTGRAAQYSHDLLMEEGSEDGNPVIVGLKYELPIDEREYVILSAEISFYRQVQANVNSLVSYTTDAMAVTQADKPYKNLADTIALREVDLEKVWFKMTRYHLL